MLSSGQEPTVNPYCKYYFIAEGANTEKFYFEKLIDERKSLGFKDTIDIRFLEKTEEDQNISFPREYYRQGFSLAPSDSPK